MPLSYSGGWAISYVSSLWRENPWLIAVGKQALGVESMSTNAGSCRGRL